MAISSPNYTQYPNEILDNMHKFSSAAVVVVNYIVRQTFGFHRAHVCASIPTIAKATGLSENTVRSAIKELLALDIIERGARCKNSSYSWRIKVKVNDTPSKFEGVNDDPLQNLKGGGAKFEGVPPQNLNPLKENKEKKKRRPRTSFDVIAMLEGREPLQVSPMLATGFPADVAELAMPFVSRLGKPTKDSKPDWIATLRDYAKRGATAEDIEEAIATAVQKGYRVSRPGSIKKFLDDILMRKEFGRGASASPFGGNVVILDDNEGGENEFPF